MLVVTRKSKEGLVIMDRETGTKVVIRFSILKDKVKVGIAASDRYTIVREEILKRDRAERVNS